MWSRRSLKQVVLEQLLKCQRFVSSVGAGNIPVARKVDIKKAMKNELPQEETLLKPYDVVYVPKSAIVKANEFIYHIYRFVPPNIWFGFSYELHREQYDY